jgi:pterin-4a-carbinolamine dehydratase
MAAKTPEGETDSLLKADVRALVENGWTLDEEQTQLEKTYFFKTFTKAVVRQPTPRGRDDC